MNLFSLLISVFYLTSSAFAACPDFSGTYLLDMPDSPSPTHLTVTQTACTSLDWKSDFGDGDVVDRPILLDGKPHRTYSTDRETITETFTLDGDHISYIANDNYVWGERFINQGVIFRDAAGNLNEVFNVFRQDGTFLYASKMPYLKTIRLQQK